MQSKIEQLVENTLNELNSCADSSGVDAVRVRILGKSGELTALLRSLKDIEADKRPMIGKLVNDARVTLEQKIEERAALLIKAERAALLEAQKTDITLNKHSIPFGALHPLTQIRNRLIDFFVPLGFIVADSPEIETEYYNFEALNIPKDHPSRESQDTFFLGGGFLLRSQTSAGQIRHMEKFKPPFKMISPGRVFRSDEQDATHSPCFHQIEGLVVDKNITLNDLKGILDEFARAFFGNKTKTRFRQSYFPFTEPSVEVDASCGQCGGKGCRICKGTGWIEILGAGIVNRKVLTNCGIDPDEYSGLAFGMGIERITCLAYQISDLRLLYENDIRFLKQFR